MCGIVGVFPLNKKNLAITEEYRRLIALWLHNEILYETVKRGKDATGVSLCYGPPAGEEVEKPNLWAVLKQPVNTSDFFFNDGSDKRYRNQDERANVIQMMSMARNINRPLRHVIGHTRHKTQGSEYNPNNNHPIIVGNIVGIHNGGVNNDHIIFKKHKDDMTRQGEVDSEAIMQLLALDANDRALGEEDIKFVTERIDGPHAVLAYNNKHPEKVIFFHDKADKRPLKLVYLEELGLAVICSEREFFETAIGRYQRLSLSLDWDLPSITWDWRFVAGGKGGVIDVTAEVEDGTTVENMFPLVECGTLLSEYDTVTRATSGGNARTGTITGGTKTGTSSPVSITKPTTVTNPTPTSPKVTKPTKPAAAEIVDMSDYGVDSSGVQASDAEMTSVSASAVMDDTGSNDDAEEEEGDSVTDLYDREDLRRKGFESAMSPDAKEDGELYINKHDGGFAKLLTVQGIDENIAAEIVHQIWPEVYADGYAGGFVDGSFEQELHSDSENQTETAVAALQDTEHQLDAAKSELMKTRRAVHRAASIIANCKAFIMAGIITGEGFGELDDGGQLEFSEHLEDYMATTKGFKKTDPDAIRSLFKDVDLKSIDEGMSAFARRVSEEQEESVAREIKERLDAPSTKSLK